MKDVFTPFGQRLPRATTDPNPGPCQNPAGCLSVVLTILGLNPAHTYDFRYAVTTTPVGLYTNTFTGLQPQGHSFSYRFPILDCPIATTLDPFPTSFVKDVTTNTMIPITGGSGSC